MPAIVTIRAGCKGSDSELPAIESIRASSEGSDSKLPAIKPSGLGFGTGRWRVLECVWLVSSRGRDQQIFIILPNLLVHCWFIVMTISF